MRIVLYILLGLLVLLMVSFVIQGRKSQNGSAPGLKDGKLSDCSSKPNCVSSEAGADEGHSVAPLTGSIAEIKQAMLDQGGVITSESSDYLSAEFISSVFKFVDDVEVRVDGQILHIRSASRVGHSDLGANRKRVDALRAALGET